MYFQIMCTFKQVYNSYEKTSLKFILIKISVPHLSSGQLKCFTCEWATQSCVSFMILNKVLCGSHWEGQQKTKWQSFSTSLRHIDGTPFFLLLLDLYFVSNVLCHFLLLYLQAGKRKLMLAWQHPPTVFTSLNASRHSAVTDIISCRLYNKTTDSSLPFLPTYSWMNAQLTGLSVCFNSLISSNSSISYTHFICLRTVNRVMGLAPKLEQIT